MNKKVLSTLAIFAIVSSTTVSASCNKYVCEGVTNVILTSVKADAQGVYARFPQGTTETLSCTLANSTDAKLNSESPNYKNMQSMLLTAVAANLPIAISFNPDAPICEIESVEIKVVE